MNRLTIRPISGLFAPTAATAAVRSAPENCRSLRYFLAVARAENITHAAESLHISQPSLSKQLMELEQEVGKQLDAGLCFRPLSPALELRHALVWKRYTVFSKAAETFLRTFREGSAMKSEKY